MRLVEEHYTCRIWYDLQKLLIALKNNYSHSKKTEKMKWNEMHLIQADTVLQCWKRCVCKICKMVPSSGDWFDFSTKSIKTDDETSLQNWKPIAATIAATGAFCAEQNFYQYCSSSMDSFRLGHTGASEPLLELEEGVLRDEFEKERTGATLDRNSCRFPMISTRLRRLEGLPGSEDGVFLVSGT